MTTDFRREIGAYRASRGTFSIVTVPPLSFLMVDGRGDPNTSADYAEALAAIYPVAYRLRFASRDLGRDYTVMPLEALWWSDDMAAFTRARDKSRWSWTLMIMTPDWITEDRFEDACVAAAARSSLRGIPRVDRVRLAAFDEGLCVQTLHVGPYDDEGPVLDELHTRFIPENGLRMTGRHHEIYLGDPRRAAPDRLRTILRQPVERL